MEKKSQLKKDLFVGFPWERNISPYLVFPGGSIPLQNDPPKNPSCEEQVGNTPVTFGHLSRQLQTLIYLLGIQTGIEASGHKSTFSSQILWL